MLKRCIVLIVVVVISTACSRSPHDSRDEGQPLVAEAAGPDLEAIAGKSRIVDLTVLLSETLPGQWAANPPLQRWTNNWFEPGKNSYGTISVPSDGPYYSQRYVIDEHTGTQTDFPSHFIPPPDSGLPFAGPMGALTGDKYPAQPHDGPRCGDRRDGHPR